MEFPYVVMARYCNSLKKIDCERENWRSVEKSEKNTLSAKTNLARVYIELNEIEKAKQYFDDVSIKTNSYKPFLVLKKRMED